MGFVPRDRRNKAALDRQLGKDLPITVFRFGPVPSRSHAQGESLRLREEWHEIHCEPELMRALPRTRFRGAFAEQVRLPPETAVSLENFEAELRAVGLIRPNELLRQGASRPLHFRVQQREVRVSDVSQVSLLRSETPPPFGRRGASLTEGHQLPLPLIEGSRAESGASLDASIKGSTPSRAYTMRRSRPAL